MLITRKTEYAIRALRSLADDGRRKVAVSQLSRELEIPRPYLRGILQTLRKKGLLYSYRGRGGGFKLARPASEIRVVDLVRIFQGPVTFDRCVFKKRVCPDIQRCVLREEIKSMEREIAGRLSSITIESLSHEGRRERYA